MQDFQLQKNNEVPTLLVKDSKNNELLCFLEQVVPINDIEYVLLTPVDTPVTLFKLKENHSWAKKGHIVASDQIIIQKNNSQRFKNYSKQKSKQVFVIEKADTLEINSGGTRFWFDLNKGQLFQVSIKQKQFMVRKKPL